MKAEEVIDFSQFDVVPVSNTETSGSVEAESDVIDFSQFDPQPAQTPVDPVALDATPETDGLRGWLDRNRARMSDTFSNVRGVDEKQSQLLGETPERRIGYGEAGVQLVGAGIGAAGEAVAETVAAATPDAVKDAAKEGIIKAFRALESTESGAKAIEYAKKGGAKWEAFAKANPQTAKTIGAAIEIGLVVVPGLKGIHGPGKLIEDFGSGLKNNAIKRRNKGLNDLLAPPHKIGDGVTGETLLGRRTYTPTAYEAERLKTVGKTKGVRPGRSFNYNQVAVAKAATKEREALQSSIRAMGNPKVDKTRIMDEMGLMVQNLEKSDVMMGLRGNKQIVDFANDIMQHAFDFVEASDGTTVGLLQARRNLDQFIEKHMKGRAYNPDLSSARDVAQKVVRDKLNGEVFRAVPEVAVKKSLTKQSHLLGARDLLLDKVRGEQESIIGRLMDDLSGTVRAGTVGQATIAKTAISAIAGATGGALSGTGILMGAAGAAGIYGLSKAARTKTAANIIKGLGGAVSKADRVVLADWVKGAGEELEEDQ